jgi:hypothetical protein
MGPHRHLRDLLDLIVVEDMAGRLGRKVDIEHVTKANGVSRQRVGLLAHHTMSYSSKA